MRFRSRLLASVLTDTNPGLRAEWLGRCALCLSVRQLRRAHADWTLGGACKSLWYWMRAGGRHHDVCRLRSLLQRTCSQQGWSSSFAANLPAWLIVGDASDAMTSSSARLTAQMHQAHLSSKFSTTKFVSCLLVSPDAACALAQQMHRWQVCSTPALNCLAVQVASPPQRAAHTRSAPEKPGLRT